MSELYDLAQDGGWTSHPGQVAGPTEREWRESYIPRRSAQVAKRQGYEVNPVNGHALECACPQCPGWYEARARMAVAAQAYSEPVVKPVAPRPLMDVVLPVAVLMMVFSLCAIVVIPVVTPLVLMSAMGLGLIAVCFAIIAVVGLALVGVVRRTAHEAAPVARAPRGRTIVGKVLGR
ncbi:membrane protein [Streptomyces phage Keanu]|nr:membrane protein [Streptomyces phage Keanu]